MNETVKTKKTLPTKWLALFVIGGLVLINIAVFRSEEISTTRFWQMFFYSLNPYYWQTWYAVNLWILFIGVLLTSLLKMKKIQRDVHAVYDSRDFQKLTDPLERIKIHHFFAKFLIRRKLGKRRICKDEKILRQNKRENLCRWVWFCVVLGILIVTFHHSVWLTTPRYYVYYQLSRCLHYFYHYIYLSFYYYPLVEFHMGKITWKLLIAPATVLLIIAGLLWLNNQIKRKKKGTKHD